MSEPIPKLLLDTCSIINLSYCPPVAAIFRSRYEGTAGWVRAAHDELVRQRGRRPPHPQAGRATNWAATWLGMSIEMTDINLILATESIQRDIAAGSTDSALDHWTRILLRELGFPHQMPSHVAFRALGWEVDLDHKTPHREARAPQSVMQESLNRDDTRLWGILCNGVTLRLLRDSATLVGSSYVEFDLKAIFDGELFSDFVLLYLTCHESRFAVQGDGRPESCYLEQWRAFAAAQGERALDQLRIGVTQAISILGTGFISHPSNPQLRHRLINDELRLDDLNRALLRLVYRILFWFVAEDRDALLQPDPDVSAETSHAIASDVSAETRAGKPYQTVLEPPPGHGPRHPAR